MLDTVSVPGCVYAHLRSVYQSALSSAVVGRSNTDDLQGPSAPLAGECWNPGGRYDLPLGEMSPELSSHSDQLGMLKADDDTDKSITEAEFPLFSLLDKSISM